MRSGPRWRCSPAGIAWRPSCAARRSARWRPGARPTWSCSTTIRPRRSAPTTWAATCCSASTAATSRRCWWPDVSCCASGAWCRSTSGPCTRALGTRRRSSGSACKRCPEEEDDMGKTPPFRVLALDGGGIRGVLPALLLGELERRTGRPTADVFDLITGTSTGGILALALTAPRPGPRFTPADLVTLYETQGGRIFASYPASAADRLVEEGIEKLVHVPDHPPEPGQPLPTTRALLHPKFGSE